MLFRSEIRIPRVTAALIVGAALGASGTIMQAITRNPLADPGLLGISAGAQLALAICMLLLPGVGYLGYTVAGISGAAIGGGLVFAICHSRLGGASPVRLLLSGAAVTALFSAFAESIGIVFRLSKSLSMWSNGGLLGVTAVQCIGIGMVIALGLLLALLASPKLTLIGLGEDRKSVV